MQTRWREDRGWETYLPVLAGGEVTLETRAPLDQFREGIKAQVEGQGMGRRSNEEVHELAKIDLQAISDYLGQKLYFLGNDPHGIDASLYAILMHILYVPFECEAKGIWSFEEESGGLLHTDARSLRHLMSALGH